MHTAVKKLFLGDTQVISTTRPHNVSTGQDVGLLPRAWISGNLAFNSRDLLADAVFTLL